MPREKRSARGRRKRAASAANLVMDTHVRQTRSQVAGIRNVTSGESIANPVNNVPENEQTTNNRREMCMVEVKPVIWWRLTSNINRKFSSFLPIKHICRVPVQPSDRREIHHIQHRKCSFLRVKVKDRQRCIRIGKYQMQRGLLQGQNRHGLLQLVVFRLELCRQFIAWNSR